MRRGMTLTELVIAIGLLAMVGWIAAAFIVPTARSFSRTSSRADLQQQALMVFSRVTADLSRTAASTVSYHNSQGPTDRMVIAMVPLEDVDPTARQVWAQRVVAYVWDPTTHALLRRVWKPGDAPTLGAAPGADSPARLEDPDLVNLGQTAGDGDDTLARDVIAADVSSSVAPPNLSMPLRLHLRLEKWSSQGAAAEAFELTRAMAVRNTSQVPTQAP